MNDNLTQPIRENYDRVAEPYARNIFDELRNKPFDREVLDRFAASITGRGQVCDMGCGPGHVARYLCDAGAAVFGLDLSPGMLAQARRLNPDIVFEQGDMLALDRLDASLVGITAFYAIVNIPAESLPRVFAEMARVLQPEGLLLLAFHIGDEILSPKEMWGQPVSMNFFYFQPARIRQFLEASGLEIEEILERNPYAPGIEHQSRRAYIFARKPAQKKLDANS